MWINKSTAKILRVFVGNLTESFTLREIARILKMHVSLAHRATKPLIDNKIIRHDKHNHLSLDYSKNHDLLSYIEYLRRNELLKKNKSLALFTEEVIETIKEDSFILLLFGSAVISQKPRDIDIMLIVDHIDKVEFHEKFIYNICGKYSLPFEPQIISFESVYEMLAKHDEKNLMNEMLNKHIILYGAELFYRLLKKGRA